MISILVLSNIFICIDVEIKLNWLNIIMFVVWLFLIVYNDSVILLFEGICD